MAATISGHVRAFTTTTIDFNQTSAYFGCNSTPTNSTTDNAMATTTRYTETTTYATTTTTTESSTIPIDICYTARKG
jgi:hypothetical protein